MTIDLTKKYTTNGNFSVIDLKYNFEPASSADDVQHSYTGIIEITNGYRFIVLYNLLGKTISWQAYPGVAWDRALFSFSDFDLVEINGYDKFKVDKDIHIMAKRKNPDIEEYVKDKVGWFSKFMENKLIMNSYKGKWDEYSLQWLFEKLLVEISELYNATVRYDDLENFNKIINESADISNYALMIADIINNKYNGGKNEEKR
jgi:hypothetical protein